jgi:hypothetical protein
MNLTFFIIIFILSSLCYNCFSIIKSLIISKDNSINSIVQETKSSVIVSKGKDRNYLIDNSDISYYTDLRHKETNSLTPIKGLLQTFNNELKSRGLTYKPSFTPFITQVAELTPLELQIIQEIIQPERLRPRALDTQNVHDTNIQKQLKSSYRVIAAKNQNLLFNEKDIISHASRTNKDTLTLNNIIEKIKNRNSSVTNFDSDNEYTVLKNTWLSGNDNVKDQIINNLLDCEENKILVCPTGTTSRIIESTYIDNPEDMPKTKNMFMTEMLSKASLIRNTLESSISHLDEDEQSTILKRNIIKSYNTDYKDILNEEQINDLTKDWIDSI